MVFNVHYALTERKDSNGAVVTRPGDIVSYQGGADDSQSECPLGCGTLVFKDSMPQMFGEWGKLEVRVDIEKKELVFINPVHLPSPISS